MLKQLATCVLFVLAACAQDLAIDRCPAGTEPDGDTCTASSGKADSQDPGTCSPDTKPAACPGGGAVHCVDGAWQCAGAPPNTCSPATKPAACPGGGAPACVGSAWQCRPLPHL
jgi:hypothetical protein